MARIIALHLYYVEPAYLYGGDLANRVNMVVGRTLDVNEFTMKEVNRSGAPSLAGLGYLYTKIVMDQFQINQETYVMQTVANITNSLNTGN